MTYETFETSQAEGDPKELYHFLRGPECWLYTSADEDTIYGGETYVARTVSRGAFTRNEEAASADVEVRLDRALLVTEQFMNQSAPDPVYLTIYRLHRTDAQAIVLFKGRVANATIELEEIVLTVQSPLGKDEKQIPRELILRTCPHVLYGAQCRVDPSSFSFATTIAAVFPGTDANHYRVASLGGAAEGFYTAGVLVKDATGQRAFIQRHELGTHLYFLKPMFGLAVSDEVTVFAGCDRTVETCRDKFNNVPQFGGFPRHPERNPFVQIPADDILE
jgi:uncharacterized phage protein (TIGR02218 family)